LVFFCVVVTFMCHHEL